MDILAYFEEGIRAIHDLIKKGDFQKAYLSCQELLKIDPYNQEVSGLLEKIQKQILDSNLQKVKEEIDKAEHLWGEGKYEELVQIYSKLLEYAPQYEKLYKLIEKANQKMGKQETDRRSVFIAQALSAIEKAFREKRYGEAILGANELLTIDPQNKRALEISKRAREEIIDQKLKENEKIVDSGEYARAVELYESLLQIDPDSEKVKRLYMDAQQHLLGKKQTEEKILVNEGVKRLKELFDAQEYEKVVEAADGILQLDSRNITAKIYRQRAEETMEKEIDLAVLKKIQGNIPALREEYQKNQAAFIRI